MKRIKPKNELSVKGVLKNSPFGQALPLKTMPAKMKTDLNTGSSKKGDQGQGKKGKKK